MFLALLFLTCASFCRGSTRLDTFTFEKKIVDKLLCIGITTEAEGEGYMQDKQN